MSKPPEHGHCENCGDPVPFGEHFCSDSCSKEYSADIKEAKRLDNRFYILMAAGIAAVAAVAFLLKTYVL
jgi:predicted nucleic acid-binding Zn ribbon protein